MQDHRPHVGVRQCRARRFRLQSDTRVTQSTSRIMHGHFELLLRWAQTAISTLTHAKHACRRLFQQQAPPPPCRHAAESKSLRLGITVADSFSYDTGQLCGPLWFDAFVIVGEPIPLATSSNARVPTRKHFTSLSLASTSSSSPISSVSRTTCESVDRRSRHPPPDTRLVSHLLDRSPASRSYIPLHRVTLRTSRRFQPRRLRGTRLTTSWFH